MGVPLSSAWTSQPATDLERHPAVVARMPATTSKGMARQVVQTARWAAQPQGSASTGGISSHPPMQDLSGGQDLPAELVGCDLQLTERGLAGLLGVASLTELGPAGGSPQPSRASNGPGDGDAALSQQLLPQAAQRIAAYVAPGSSGEREREQHAGLAQQRGGPSTGGGRCSWSEVLSALQQQAFLVGGWAGGAGLHIHFFVLCGLCHAQRPAARAPFGKRGRKRVWSSFFAAATSALILPCLPFPLADWCASGPSALAGCYQCPGLNRHHRPGQLSKGGHSGQWGAGPGVCPRPACPACPPCMRSGVLALVLAAMASGAAAKTCWELQQAAPASCLHARALLAGLAGTRHVAFPCRTMASLFAPGLRTAVCLLRPQPFYFLGCLACFVTV